MTRFAVAAGHDVTADAAADILRAGGTAVDASIAASMAAMVAEPVFAGMLGGGFLTVRTANGRVHVLDFFVQTPLRELPGEDLDIRTLTADFGTATQDFYVGAGTVATPGVALGLTEAHARFGRIPMTTLAEPAFTAARKGVSVTAFQARLLEIVRPIYTATPGAEAMYAPGDALLSEGSDFRNPAFADVLEEFAHDGARFVTEGEVAQALLSVCDQGGHLTSADLVGYKPVWREALAVDRYRARIFLNPAPSLGGLLIAFGLGMLPRNPSPAEVVHGLALTVKARIEAALDEDALAGARRLLHPDFVETYRQQIRHRMASTQGTTHISIIDGDGMGAALTLSNGTGAGMLVPGTGIMPNNMLGEADLLPKGLHGWPTGQRLASMMAPLVVAWPDDRFAMMGSGGSNRIRSALLQVVLGVLDSEMPLADAVDAPRIHVEGHPDQVVDFEDLGGDAFRDAVMGVAPDATPWREPSMFFGGVHAVQRDTRGGLSGAGDPRRAGVVRLG